MSVNGFGTAELTLDQEQIIEFAKQFDPQPFHLDPDAAKSTLFKGLAASGWHTASLTMKLLVTSGMPVAGGLIGAGGEAQWPIPTCPGDRLHVESEVMEKAPSKSGKLRGIVTVKNETINQNGEVVQRLISKLVVPYRRGEDPLRIRR